MSQNRTSRSQTSLVPVLCATLLAATTPGIARASIDVQTMIPATNSTYVFTEDAMMEVTPRDRSWNGQRLFFAAQFNVLNDPLVTLDPTRTQRTAVLVDSLNTLDVGAGIFLARDLAINLNMPLNLVHIPDMAAQFALGDMIFRGKWQLADLNQALVAIALVPEIRLPTGDRGNFLSHGSFGGGLHLAFERDFGGIRASANVGYRNTPGATFGGLDYRQQLPLSLGSFIPLGSKDWALNVEGTGSISVPISKYNNPGELYVGARYEIARDAAINFGFSVGSLDGVGSSDHRFVMGVKFSPMPPNAEAHAKSAPIVTPVVAPLPPPAPPKPVPPPVKKPAPKPAKAKKKAKPVKKGVANPNVTNIIIHNSVNSVNQNDNKSQSGAAANSANDNSVGKKPRRSAPVTSPGAEPLQ